MTTVLVTGRPASSQPPAPELLGAATGSSRWCAPAGRREGHATDPARVRREPGASHRRRRPSATLPAALACRRGGSTSPRSRATGTAAASSWRSTSRDPQRDRRMQASGVRRLVHLGALGVEDRSSSITRIQGARRAGGDGERARLDILKPSLLFGPGDGFFNIVAGLVRLSPESFPFLATGKPLPAPSRRRLRCAALCWSGPRRSGMPSSWRAPIWTYREITAEVCRATAAAASSSACGPAHLAGGRCRRGRPPPFPVATDQLRQLALDNVGRSTACTRHSGSVPRRMEGELLYLRRRRRSRPHAPRDVLHRA